MTAPRNLLTEWSRLLLWSLQQAGLRDVIISPGSRSTPFAWAALHCPGLRCHSVLDERSAGFFALGIARATGVPPLLLCTSGTAAAHYFPAVIEAAMSYVPLLILTADRPSELQGCAAPQTIDQTRLYGEHVRSFWELGDPQGAPEALRALNRKAVQAFAETQTGTPGPVHLNAPARKPLEPQQAETADEQQLCAQVDSILAQQPVLHRAEAQIPAVLLDSWREQLAHAQRPLVVLGACPPEVAQAVQSWAERSSVPLWAETASHSSVDAPVELFLRQPGAGGQEPDVLLRLGPPLTSSRFAEYLKRANARQLLWAEHGYPDPTQSAHEVLIAPWEISLRAWVEEPLSASSERSHFFHIWKQAAARLAQGLDQDLSELPAGELLSEPHAVAQLLRGVPAETQLLLGNSLVLRLIDWVAPSAWREHLAQESLRIFVHRGVNGIDGFLAEGAGIAQASGRPTLACVGDVTAAHDWSSLAVARKVTTPYCIAVVDNRGGRIFDQLPLFSTLQQADAASVGRSQEELAAFWSTPPQLNFEQAAQAYGVRYRRAAQLHDVSGLVQEALSIPGATLLHLPTEPCSTAEWLRQLSSAQASVVSSS